MVLRPYSHLGPSFHHPIRPPTLPAQLPLGATATPANALTFRSRRMTPVKPIAASSPVKPRPPEMAKFSCGSNHVGCESAAVTAKLSLARISAALADLAAAAHKLNNVVW